MRWFEIFWNYEDDDGNVAPVAEHGLTPDDVKAVLRDPEESADSDSSGRFVPRSSATSRR